MTNSHSDKNFILDNILSPIRGVIFTFLYFPLLTAILGLAGILSVVITGHRRGMERVSQIWAQSVLDFLNIKVIESGRDLRPKTGCLYLFNHTSFLDIMVMMAKIEAIHFGAKIELFRIPIFGRSMKMAGVLPIARNNREEVMQVYKAAEERAQQGEQFALSPEGKRNHEEKLLRFKSGPFVFAINAGIPVVPVVIKGASLLWSKGTFIPCVGRWKSEIQMVYLPCTKSNEYSLEKRSELSKKVREQMLPYFPGSEI